MRIGLIADVHANLQALRAVLEALSGVDAILCAGDLTGYFTCPNEVIDELSGRGIEFIAGNHDVYLRRPPASANATLRRSLEFTRATITKKNADALAAAPCQKHLTLDGLRISLFHGSPWDAQEQYIYPDFKDWQRFAEVDADVIVLGHTHRPFLREVAGRLVINPGSCGQPRDGDPRASFAVLDTRTRQVQFARAAYDVDAAVDEAQRLGLGRPLHKSTSLRIPTSSANGVGN
ncbi:MAG: metallophosphoesterase family protein [Tepidisphaeraceae bacterium]|jgi:putative phosphoesterase